MSADRVVVDTTVWSLLLRRAKRDLSPVDRASERHLRELISTGRAILLGMVRLEILSGIEDPGVFNRIESQLEGFDDLPPDIDDYVRAAMFSNRCKSAGVAASPIDMLICGMAAGRDLTILTTDKDFYLYQQALSIQLETV